MAMNLTREQLEFENTYVHERMYIWKTKSENSTK